jgi:hypothetical protein
MAQNRLFDGGGRAIVQVRRAGRRHAPEGGCAKLGARILRSCAWGPTPTRFALGGAAHRRRFTPSPRAVQAPRGASSPRPSRGRGGPCRKRAHVRGEVRHVALGDLPPGFGQQLDAELAIQGAGDERLDVADTALPAEAPEAVVAPRQSAGDAIAIRIEGVGARQQGVDADGFEIRKAEQGRRPATRSRDDGLDEYRSVRSYGESLFWRAERVGAISINPFDEQVFAAPASGRRVMARGTARGVEVRAQALRQRERSLKECVAVFNAARTSPFEANGGKGLRSALNVCVKHAASAPTSATVWPLIRRLGG